MPQAIDSATDLPFWIPGKDLAYFHIIIPGHPLGSWFLPAAAFASLRHVTADHMCKMGGLDRSRNDHKQVQKLSTAVHITLGKLQLLTFL